MFKKKTYLSAYTSIHLSTYLRYTCVNVQFWRKINVSKAVSHDYPWNCRICFVTKDTNLFYFQAPVSLIFGYFLFTFSYSPLSLLSIFGLRTLHLHIFYFVPYMDQRQINNRLRTKSGRVCFPFVFINEDKKKKLNKHRFPPIYLSNMPHF